MARIYYKSGYKYQLTSPYMVDTAVTPRKDVDTEYMHLAPSGVLSIQKGYCWDGPSGPSIDTKSFMRGSLVHDALYQMMRNGLLDKDGWREVADQELRRMCREDGMSRLRAWWVYHVVRLAADGAASSPAIRLIHSAPY